MSVVATRLKYGSLAVGLVVGVFWLDLRVWPGVVGSAIIALMALAAQAEFYSMSRSKSPSPDQEPMVGWGLMIGALFLVATALPAGCCEVSVSPWVVLQVGISLLFVGSVLSRRPQGAPERLGATLLGILAVPVLLSTLIQIRLFEDGWAWLVFLVAVAKAGDSFAFFAGKFLGRKKLIPEVSPNKTWMGSWGSLLGSALAAWLVVTTAFETPPTLTVWLGAALAVNLGAQFGDLVESLLKRGCEVKDSSTLIPVMGGAFDLVDSFLIAGPALWFFLNGCWESGAVQ